MTETQPQTEPGFGAAMERLEAIVARLEGDETLELEEALDLYQQGVTLAGECRRRLQSAQLTLTELALRPPGEDDPPGDGPPEEPEGSAEGDAPAGSDAPAPAR